MSSKVVRGIGVLALSAGLVLGVASGVGAAANHATTTKADTATSAVCTQLRKRLAGAPATLRRVDANLAELRAALAEARLPARRAVLELRIQRLEQLRSALSERIADARAACSSTT